MTFPYRNVGGRAASGTKADCNPPHLFMMFPTYAEIDQTLNPAGLVHLIGEVSGNWVEQGRLYEVSLAMRAAQADEKGWRRWVEMVSRHRGKAN